MTIHKYFDYKIQLPVTLYKLDNTAKPRCGMDVLHIT